ncbi:MAG: gliding motility-associated C-terminal domain-containing protein [Bacteroidales bacterium]|nr:gliding motility-associated C-terminal domain-containing protein [Bacteroidales bacterium]
MKNINRLTLYYCRSVLTFILFLFCSFTANALTVQKGQTYNGTCTVTSVGTRYLLTCSGYDGQIQISGESFSNFYIDSDFKSWQDGQNRMIQPDNRRVSGDYCVLYDSDTRTLTLTKGNCGATIRTAKEVVCPGSIVSLTAYGTNSDDTWRWGISDGTISWLDFDNREVISQVVNKTTTFVLEQTTSSGLVNTSTLEIVTSLAECGYSVKTSATYACPGQEITLSTDYTTANTYVWKEQSGIVVATTSTPYVIVVPTAATTYTLYADDEFVGSVTVNTGECQFYVSSYYPTATCLQDSNYLLALGASVLADIDNDVFQWEISTDRVTWTEIPGAKKSRLAVNPEIDCSYRVTYSGLTSPPFAYHVPDCGKNENCQGLQTRVLFYETFGYFIDENTYVARDGFYKDDMTMYGTVAAYDRNSNFLGYAGNTQGYGDYLDRIKSTSDYYKARAVDGATLRVSSTGQTQFHIMNYVAPDPYGYVVTATEFERDPDHSSNQFVGTNGHLFLAANPLLPQYESWTEDPAFRLQDGYYALVANPRALDQHEGKDYMDCSDATGNVNGAMLFVNSGKTDISHSAIYAQRVDLNCAADRFSFGMNVRNAAIQEGLNPVNISVYLLEDIGNVLPDEYRKMGTIQPEHILSNEITSGDVPSASSDWTRIDQYVQIPNGKKVSSLWVVLYNNGKTGDGNDMLLDDISFSVCLPKAELSANIDGILIEKDVAVCDGRDVQLVARQKGDYILNPLYLFQYYDEKDGSWKDMKDYSISNSYKDTTVTIPVTDIRFIGSVKYRVIVGASVDELRQVALNPTDVCNEFLVAESDIDIYNTYGGPMCEDVIQPFCFVEGDTITVEGCRKLTDPKHEWKAYWTNSKGDLLVDTADFTAKKSDVLYFVIKKGDVVEVYDRDWKQTLETDFDGIANLSFVGLDEGGCKHSQSFTMTPKHIVELRFDGTSAVGCDSILVEVSKDVEEAPLVWDWGMEGRTVVVNDTAQIFHPTGLEETNTKAGILKIWVDDSRDAFCAPAYPLEIPYHVNNSSYDMSVIPSSNPVCVTKGQAPGTQLLTLTADIKPVSANTNISSYNWLIQFEKGDRIEKTTTDPTWILTYADLEGRTGQKLWAYLLSTETLECGTIKNDTANSSTEIDIREGGFALSVQPDTSSVCLTSETKFELTANVEPPTAMTSLKELMVMDELGLVEKIATNEDQASYTIVIDKEHFPNVFKAGTTKTYHIAAYDSFCQAKNVSENAIVKFNGYKINLEDPDHDGKECLTLGDKLTISAKLDDPNAANLVKTLLWYKDNVLVGTSGWSHEFEITESTNSRFKLVASDGICTDQADSIDVAVSMRYEVDLNASQETVCGESDSAYVQVKVTPASSMLQIKRFEWHAVVNGMDQILLKGTKKDSILVLSKANYPSLIQAGVDAEIYVIADDSICEQTRSNGDVHFDFNTHYDMTVDWDTAQSICVPNEANIDPSLVLLSVDVKINPSEAGLQIHDYTWHIKGDKESVWTDFKTTTSHKDFTYADLSKYAGQDISLYVSSVDSVCTTPEDPALSDTVKVKIRTGGFTITMGDIPSSYCIDTLDPDAKFVLKAAVIPDHAKANISNYYWYDNGGLLAITTADSLVLSQASYGHIFKAGHIAHFSVNAYDEACAKDTIRDESSTTVEFSTKYSMKVNWDTDNAVCVTSEENVDPNLELLTVEVLLFPADVDSVIKEYTWNIKGDKESTWTQFKTTTNKVTFTYADLNKYRGEDIRLFVSSYDNACYSISDPALSDTVTLKIRTGGFQIKMGDIPNSYCIDTLGDAKFTLSVTFIPEDARNNVSEFFWYDNGGLIAKTSEPELVITKAEYASIFRAGYTANFSVAVYDEACAKDTIRTVDTTKVEFNVPFTLRAGASASQVCLPVSSEVYLYAKTTPEDAHLHIKKYVWHLTSPIEQTVETTVGELDIKDWLSLGKTLKFDVKAYDEVCYNEGGAGATTEDSLQVNQGFTPTLSVDKEFVCTENSLLELKATIDPPSAYIASYKFYVKDYATDKDTLVELLKEDYDIIHYYERRVRPGYYPKDMKPGDKMGLYVVADDGGICGARSSDIVNVTVQTPFKVHLEMDPAEICINTPATAKVVSITPPEAEQFVKYYNWYEIDRTMPSLLQEKGGKVYSSANFPAGRSYLFARAIDSICYTSRAQNSDTVNVFVHDYIRLNFHPSVATYCYPIDGYIDLIAECETGVPVTYELYDLTTGKLLSTVNSTRTTCVWEGIQPTTTFNQFMVKVRDGVCSTSDESSIVDYTSVLVHEPVEISLEPVRPDVCIGDTTMMILNIVSGTPSKYHMEGFSNGLSFEFPARYNDTIIDYAASSGVIEYMAYAIDDICPNSDTIYNSVNIHEIPKVQLVANKEYVVIGGEIDFTAEILAGEPTVYEWLCDGESIDVTHENRLTYLPKSTSEYMVYAADMVCPSTYSSMVLECKLPTAFTPFIKDGLNDTFMRGFDVLIFDRYGQKIFEGNEGWDGTFRDKMADPGVYFYKVIMKNNKVETGTVEVIYVNK